MSGDSLPTAKDVERAFVGALLELPEALERLPLPDPDPMLFSDRRVLAVYEVILELHRAGVAVDVVSVGDSLARREHRSSGDVTAELVGLLGACPTSQHAESYLRLMRTNQAKRKLTITAGRFARLAYGNTHTRPEDVLADASAAFESMRSGIPLTDPERIYSAAELDRLTFEREAYLLEAGLVPSGGLTLFAGDVGGGKSISSLDLSLAIASGGGPAWNTTSAGGAVLYLGADNSAREMQRNLRKLAQARGLMLTDELPLWVILERFELDRPEGRLRLDGLMREREPALVVVDTVGQYAGATDLNDYASVGRLLGGVRDLADKHGAAVILVHHLNKGQGPIVRRLIDRINGSVALVGSVNDVLALTVEQTAGETVRTVTLCKGRDEPVAPMSFVMQSGPEGGLSLCYKRGDEAVAERSLSDRIRGALAEVLEGSPGRSYMRKELEVLVSGIGLKYQTRTMTAALASLETIPEVSKSRAGRSVVYSWGRPETMRLPETEAEA
jgi:archaellum biogenesis ATPase FlaH